MTDVVTAELKKAFAFIYLVNAANAGGVQEDRVREN